MKLEEHEDECRQVLGKPFTEVHRFLDQFAGRPECGMRHRCKLYIGGMMTREDYQKMKGEQLGMAVATARCKLMKKLIFSLIQQCGKDTCYRCGNQILTEEELSVDHKKAWLHEPNAVDLYFDIGNVAFSHNKCNSQYTRPKKVTGHTGFKGVRYDPSRGRTKPFRARLFTECKETTIGYYTTAEEAAQAYDKAAIEKLGEKAVTNKSMGLL